MDMREQWKADYWKAVDALAAHDAKVAPLIAERDKLQASFEPQLRELNQKVKAAQAPRHDLQLRVKYLTAALGGSIGERPAG
ncbi:MAG: hypothetical protein U1E23_14770 [Reyranellaceae bacterium]